jgi:ketosteroid isomerase-like protein
MSRSWRFRRVVPLLLSLSLPSGVAAAQGVETPHIPLRTVIDQLNSTRSSYMDAFNRKDASGVAAFYLDEAIVTRPDGSRLMGGKEIGDAIRAESANWPHLVLSSDTVRVYGGTAIDFGTAKMHPADGGEQVSHYTAVLRRGLKGWRIAALSQVAVTGKTGD